MKKLFYVEKESFLRLMIEEAMKLEGHQVQAVEDAKDIEYLVVDMKPDFILFDLETIADHVSLVRELLNHGVVSQIPHGFTGKEELLHKLGFGGTNEVFFIEKPIAPLELIQTLFDY